MLEVVKFTQTDQNEYTLQVDGDDCDTSLFFTVDEAVKLYEAVVECIGSYVFEMAAAKASYDRGEGPNGEPPGWVEAFEATTDPLEQADIVRDRMRNK